MQRLFILLDLLVNRLPFLRGLDGYKTVVGGVLTAVAEFMRQIVPYVPGEYQATVTIAEQFTRELAGYIVIWGVSGKGVKVISK